MCIRDSYYFCEGQLILLIKQPLQGSMHLISGVILKLHRQIRRQLIRIVVDFIKVIPVDVYKRQPSISL